ncbi:MAG: glycosyltransferase family 2 protein [Gammaproteobacteria bacterium]
MKAPVTVFVLTLNEEHYIRRCIEQLTPWAGEVLVVDSQSTDRTREIAEAAGARVVVQPWLGWVGQHHFAMDAGRFDWCFKVDADEIVDDELGAAVLAALSQDPDPRTGFVIERIEEFCSALMPNARRRTKRDSFIRVMNRKVSRYDTAMLIHEEIVAAGPRVRLPGRMLHWRDFDLTARFAQDNKNATLEAKSLEKNGARWSFSRLVIKPILRFLWVYVRSGAWRAGSHGLVYSMTRATAEFMRQAKLWEAQAVQHQRHPPRELYSRTAACIEQPELADGR